MGTLAALISGLADDATTRGRQFEHICKWFLETDPIYAPQLKHVWLWKDWPGRWGADAGIDLVAETTDGKVWAIQAKAYAPGYAIKKSDVDTFLSESSREVRQDLFGGHLVLVALRQGLDLCVRAFAEALDGSTLGRDGEHALVVPHSVAS